MAASEHCIAAGLVAALTAGCAQSPCIAVQPPQVLDVHLVRSWEDETRTWGPLHASPACLGVDGLPSDFTLVARRLTPRADRRLCSVVEFDLVTSLDLPAASSTPVVGPEDLEGGSVLSARAVVDGCPGRWTLLLTPRDASDASLLGETTTPPDAPPFTVLRTWQRESATGACATAEWCSDLWSAEVRLRSVDAGGEE